MSGKIGIAARILFIGAGSALLLNCAPQGVSYSGTANSKSSQALASEVENTDAAAEDGQASPASLLDCHADSPDPKNAKNRNVLSLKIRRDANAGKLAGELAIDVLDANGAAIVRKRPEALDVRRLPGGAIQLVFAGEAASLKHRFFLNVLKRPDGTFAGGLTYIETSGPAVATINGNLLGIINVDGVICKLP